MTLLLCGKHLFSGCSWLIQLNYMQLKDSQMLDLCKWRNCKDGTLECACKILQIELHTSTEERMHQRKLLALIMRLMQQHIDDSWIVLEMELNRTVKALQFYFKGILHLSLEIQTDRTPKVISVVSSNLGIFWNYCSVLILQSLWFFFEHLKILCCKQFVYQKLVMIHYHQTCIFHSPQASHQAAKQISTSLGFVSPSLLMLHDYRSL